MLRTAFSDDAQRETERSGRRSAPPRMCTRERQSNVSLRICAHSTGGNGESDRKSRAPSGTRLLKPGFARLWLGRLRPLPSRSPASHGILRRRECPAAWRWQEGQGGDRFGTRMRGVWEDGGVRPPRQSLQQEDPPALGTQSSPGARHGEGPRGTPSGMLPLPQVGQGDAGALSLRA